MSQGSASHSISKYISEDQVVLKADSFEPLFVAAVHGLGLAYLPCFMGESSRKLQKVNIMIDQENTGLWIMTHADLKNSAKVRAFFEFMETELKADFNRLANLGDLRHKS